MPRLGNTTRPVAEVHFRGKGQILGGLHRPHHGRTDFAFRSKHAYPHGLNPRPCGSRRVPRTVVGLLRRAQEFRKNLATIRQMVCGNLIRPVLAVNLTKGPE